MDQFLEFIVNHPYLWALFFLALLLLVYVELSAKLSSAKQLSPPDLTAKMNHEDALVIDLREKATFKEGHIVSAENLPATELDKIKKKLEQAKQKPVVLVCNLGTTSAQIANKLKKEGFDHIYTLAGGITAWRNAGLPLTK